MSVLTLGEIQKGISKLSKSNKKESLIFWIQNDLRERFNSRIISIDDRIALKWGTIQGESEKKGKKMSVIDSLIASTAIVYNFTVASRNEKDLIDSKCKILNPWE